MTLDGDEFLTLPDQATFDDDERLFAQVAIGWARRTGTMFEGRLLECHVARILAAKFPPTAISPWDLLVDNHIRAQVRSASQGRVFKLLTTPANDDCVDVWVLVEKPTDTTTAARENMRYFVLSKADVVAIAHKYIAHGKVIARYPSCGDSDLLQRVRERAADQTAAVD